MYSTRKSWYNFWYWYTDISGWSMKLVSSSQSAVSIQTHSSHVHFYEKQKETGSALSRMIHRYEDNGRSWVVSYWVIFLLKTAPLCGNESVQQYITHVTKYKNNLLSHNLLEVNSTDLDVYLQSDNNILFQKKTIIV